MCALQSGDQKTKVSIQHTQLTFQTHLFWTVKVYNLHYHMETDLETSFLQENHHYNLNRIIQYANHNFMDVRFQPYVTKINTNFVKHDDRLEIAQLQAHLTAYPVQIFQVQLRAQLLQDMALYLNMATQFHNEQRII